MRRENGLCLGVMGRRLQTSIAAPLSTHNRHGKENKDNLKRLPNELQESSNVLMLPYDQIWIHSAFRSLQKSLAASVTGTISRILCFLRGIYLGGGISDNCCSVMGRRTYLGGIIWCKWCTSVDIYNTHHLSVLL